MRNLALALSASTLFAMAGCTESEVPDDGSKNDDTDVLGAYSVSTPVEIPQALAGLPAMGPALIELRGATANPGEAVLNAIAAADVGQMSTLLSAMPSAIRAQIVARLNVFLDPVKQDIASLAGQLEQVLTAFEIQSEIKITDRQKLTGVTTEEHRVRTIVFKAGGKSAEVDVPEVMDEGHGRISSDGKLRLDSVELELAIGPLAVQAANIIVFPQFGASDLNGALEAVIDCDQIGASIEEVVTFVDAKGKCHEALANLAAKITTKTEEVEDKLVLAISDAQGVLKNGVIGNGKWTWEIQLGGFKKELQLAFEARRQ